MKFQIWRKHYKLIKLGLLAAENICEDLQYVVKMDVMLSPGTTSHGITNVGRGRTPFHGPTFWESTGPKQGKSRVFKGFT
jgi:hypothetical protein